MGKTAAQDRPGTEWQQESGPEAGRKWDCPKNARRYVGDVRLSMTNGTDFPGDFNKIQNEKLKQTHIEELGWRESRLIQELQSVS